MALGIAQGHHLCVWTSRLLGVAAPDHAAVNINDDTTHAGVWLAKTNGVAGKRQGFLHWRRRTRAGIHLACRACAVLDVANQLTKFVHVFETAVHRGEAHISHLVYALELTHYELTKARGWDFLGSAVE
jgi:hypothetical protein